MIKTDGRILFYFATVFLVLVSGFFLFPYGTRGSTPPAFMSDLLSTSNPSVGANHTITFQIPSAIPLSGSMTITPDAAFVFPSTLDYTSFDLATSGSSTGPYSDRSLAATASPTDDGASVVSGMGGSFTIKLNSTAGISSGKFVRITVGTNASFGATGTDQIGNPTSTGSYKIKIATNDASNALINAGATMVAIVAPVAMEANTFDFAPPVLSNPLPSGSIPAGIRFVEISVNTDEIATCRYATSSGLDYGSMPDIFSVTGGITFHTTVISTPTDNTDYVFNVRCEDVYHNKDQVDFPVAFHEDAPLPPPAPPGSGGSGGGGGGGGGGGAPYPPTPSQPQLFLSGYAYPGSKVTILQDGKVYGDALVDRLGAFTANMQNVTQGVYTFGVYATDDSGRESSLYSTTLTLISGTRDSISGIVVPPTISTPKDTINPGDTAIFSGKAVPSSTLEVSVTAQTRGKAVKNNITSDTTGSWQFSLDTTGFTVDTYEVKVRTVAGALGTSNFSKSVYIGVGTSPSPNPAKGSDLNGDGKVNLVDFSVLLFHWGSAGPEGDINHDGKVNLTDLSILLFNWTG